MRHFVSLLVFLWMLVTPASGKPVVITNDRGGLVIDYNMRWYQYSLLRTKVIIDGPCVSACARYMSLPRVCATKRGYFYLHGITINGRVVEELGRIDSQQWDTERGFEIETRYNTFAFGFTTERTKPKYLEPGIWKITVPAGNVYQEFLKVKATVLVPRC